MVIAMEKEFFMKEALDEAKKAMAQEEVPVGAVIVYENRVIARGHNGVETMQNPLKHAEIMAINEACKNLKTKNLKGCTMYVTVEPCNMCGGAIVLSRISKLVYAAKDPKAGACGSLYNIVQDERLNHFVEVESGILESESRKIIQDFFKELRRRGRRNYKDEED